MAEILATLDEKGTLGNLPFMPEMLPFAVVNSAFRAMRLRPAWTTRRCASSMTPCFSRKSGVMARATAAATRMPDFLEKSVAETRGTAAAETAHAKTRLH